MKQVTVLYGQTLIDIAIQELGDFERAFELGKLNRIGLTDDLTAGSIILVPDYSLDKKEVVKVFTNPANKPASGTRSCNGEVSSGGEGIGYWAIEVDNIVS